VQEVAPAALQLPGPQIAHAPPAEGPLAEPAAQAEQLAAPPSANWPGAQASQAVLAALATVPFAHGVHDAAPSGDVEPAAQAVGAPAPTPVKVPAGATRQGPALEVGR